MESGKRVVIGGIWVLVAALIALSIDPATQSTVALALRGFVVALALFLAVVYAFDPRGIVTRKYDWTNDEE